MVKDQCDLMKHVSLNVMFNKLKQWGVDTLYAKSQDWKAMAENITLSDAYINNLVKNKLEDVLKRPDSWLQHEISQYSIQPV